MRDPNDKYPELQLQVVEPSEPTVQPTLPADLIARLAIMLCDDPTDPDMVGIEGYLEIARRH